MGHWIKDGHIVGLHVCIDGDACPLADLPIDPNDCCSYVRRNDLRRSWGTLRFFLRWCDENGHDADRINVRDHGEIIYTASRDEVENRLHVADDLLRYLNPTDPRGQREAFEHLATVHFPEARYVRQRRHYGPLSEAAAMEEDVAPSVLVNQAHRTALAEVISGELERDVFDLFNRLRWQIGDHIKAQFPKPPTAEAEAKLAADIRRYGDEDLEDWTLVQVCESEARRRAGLTAAEEQVWSLYWDEGLQAVEIAEILGCAPATVRVHRYNARQKFKKVI